MIGLSLILFPVLVLQLIFRLSPPVRETLNLIDYAILLIFILEYISKLAVAEDHRAFILDPWHILDLFIIIVPMAGLLLGSGYEFGKPLRLLRMLRITQALALGGRAHKRRQYLLPPEETAVTIQPELHAQRTLLDGKDRDILQSVWVPVSLSALSQNEEGMGWWLDITSISGQDLPEISRISGVPKYTLENKLETRAYPQTEISNGRSLIFARIPEVRFDDRDRRLAYIDWKGLLFINDDRRIITLSRQEISYLKKVPEEAEAEGLPLTPPVIVYLLMRNSLSTVEDLILTTEEELVALESLPSSMLPPKFLSAISKIKRVTSIIISWLLHQKEVLSEINEGNAVLSGLGEEDKARFNALLDHCSYIYDAASNANENISSIIDFYINATSFQMNRVMKVLAVMTALAIIPTIVGGILGTNIIGNPWEITLAQLMTLVAILMLSTGWTYYKLGWLK